MLCVYVKGGVVVSFEGLFEHVVPALGEHLEDGLANAVEPHEFLILGIGVHFDLVRSAVYVYREYEGEDEAFLMVAEAWLHCEERKAMNERMPKHGTIQKGC